LPRTGNALRAALVAVATVFALAAGGCEEPDTGPAPTQTRISLSCVETVARGDAAVAAVRTIAPTRGLAAGARRYVNVRFKGGASITVTEWRDEAAEARAIRSYMRLGYSLGSIGTRPKILEALSQNLPPGALDAFRRCGLGQP
jgi:hypothetical protein